MSRRTNRVVAPGCGGVPAFPQVHIDKSDAQITSIGSVGVMVTIVCKHSAVNFRDFGRKRVFKCVSRRTNQVVAPGCGGVPALPQVHIGKSDAQITSIGSVGTMDND